MVAAVLGALPFGLARAGEDVCIGAGASITAGPSIEGYLPPHYVSTRVRLDVSSGLLVDTGEVVYEESRWDLLVLWALAALTALAVIVATGVLLLRRRK